MAITNLAWRASAMNVTLHHPDDRQRLEQLIRAERDAKQRDRFRAVLLATRGEQSQQIVAKLERSRRFVQAWAYAYRDGGIEALSPGKSSGRPVKLARDREQAFVDRIKAGPAESDVGVCTLRGEDARRILEREFGARYTLQGVYDLLDRLNLSCLVPRPRHRKNDPAAMSAWLERAPFLSAT
jgi:transposase